VNYNSPDEKAHYFFSRLLAEKNSLSYQEPLNNIAFGLVRPRSTGVIGDNIVPGSFLGNILFTSFFARLFNANIIPLIISLFSAITPIFFYLLIGKIFNRKTAFISAILLFLFPAFWYYSTRSLFPNILFVNLLIFAFCCFTHKKKNNFVPSFALSVIGGLALGFSMGVRSNEFLWVGLVLVLLLLGFRKKINFSYIFTIIIFAIISLWPILQYNNIVFGNPFFTGYFEINNLFTDSNHTTSSTIFSVMKASIAPFGFDLSNIIKNSYYYLIHIFFWFLIPFIMGLTWFISRLKSRGRNELYYFISYLGVSCFLLIYYGSWQFNDHPDPNAISIGTSFVRYWLPIYILSLPYIAQALIQISEAPKYIINHYSKILSTIILSVLILLLGVYSSTMVIWSTDESIINVIASINKGKKDANIIRNITDTEALIIVDSDDKFLFPDRSVMTPFRNDFIINAIPDLLKTVPVYYFGLTLPDKDMEYLNNKKLYDRDLQIKEFYTINEKTLYKIY
jgi:hypothetical protein